MRLEDLKQTNNILIYGYGVEGKSTQNFLERQGIECDIHDDKQEKYSTKKNIDSYDVIIVSAGIQRDIFSSAQQKKCTSNTEIFFHNLSTKQQRKIIGVTGTKGKSMTAKLTHEVLENARYKSLLAGNIGVAPLNILDQIDSVDWVVLELSSFQLQYLDTSPPLAICTNLFKDHIDWHGSVQVYHQAKENLWKHQKAGDILLVPEIHQSQFNRQQKIICPEVDQALIPQESIWQARHYRQNFGLVQSLTKHLQIPTDIFEQTLYQLTPLPHRLSTVGTFQGIRFIDNAISTNPHSTMADLVFFGPDLGSIILGGKDRGQVFTPLFSYLETNHIQASILLEESETTDRIIAELTQDFPNLNYFIGRDMQQVVDLAYKHTPKNKTCLLSPASASWDKYKSYNEKGDIFTSSVLTNRSK